MLNLGSNLVMKLFNFHSSGYKITTHRTQIWQCSCRACWFFLFFVYFIKLSNSQILVSFIFTKALYQLLIFCILIQWQSASSPHYHPQQMHPFGFSWSLLVLILLPISTKKTEFTFSLSILCFYIKIFYSTF